MNLYVILKDGQPYITNSDNKPYVKAYYDEQLAKKTAKSFCTSEANTYFRYEGRDLLEQEGFIYPEVMKEIDKRAKQLAREWMPRWTVKELNL